MINPSSSVMRSHNQRYQNLAESEGIIDPFVAKSPSTGKVVDDKPKSLFSNE